VLVATIPYDECVYAQSAVTQCASDFLEVLNPSNLEHIAMLDYTGKAINDMGNYDGCLKLDQNLAHYCVLETVITVKMANEHLPAYMGLCAPASCNDTDLEIIVESLFTNPSWNISTRFSIGEELKDFTAHCTPGHETKTTAGAIVTIVLLVLISLLVIAGTYLESVQKQAQEYNISSGSGVAAPSGDESRALLINSQDGDDSAANKVTNNNPRTTFSLPLSRGSKAHHRSGLVAKLQEVVKCFGIRANTKYLFADNRASEPSLACLNGLRTIMMGWVVLGHTFTYMAAPVGYDNLMTIKDLVSRVSFQVVPAAARNSISFKALI